MAVCGVDHADGQATRHQREKAGDFFFVERKDPLVTREDRRSDVERILFTKNSVCGGHGRFGGSESHVHVAEIDDADDFLRVSSRRIEKGVVVIGIAIDNTAAKTRKTGNNLLLEQL